MREDGKLGSPPSGYNPTTQPRAFCEALRYRLNEPFVQSSPGPPAFPTDRPNSENAYDENTDASKAVVGGPVACKLSEQGLDMTAGESLPLINVPQEEHSPGLPQNLFEFTLCFDFVT